MLDHKLREFISKEMMKMQRLSYQEGIKDGLDVAAEGFRAVGMEEIAKTVEGMAVAMLAIAEDESFRVGE